MESIGLEKAEERMRNAYFLFLVLLGQQLLGDDLALHVAIAGGRVDDHVRNGYVLFTACLGRRHDDDDV